MLTKKCVIYGGEDDYFRLQDITDRSNFREMPKEKKNEKPPKYEKVAHGGLRINKRKRKEKNDDSDNKIQAIVKKKFKYDQIQEH